jgi:hypothetical protein
VLASLWSGVVLYVLQLVAVRHLMFISFCLCIAVSSAIVFNYVVNFKLLCIGRGNYVILTYFVAAFVTCVAFKMESGVMN